MNLVRRPTAPVGQEPAVCSSTKQLLTGFTSRWMAHQKTFYQISRVVITDIRYGIVKSSDSPHCKVVIGSQKWRSSKQEEENGAANGPQVRTVFAIREEGREE